MGLVNSVTQKPHLETSLNNPVVYDLGNGAKSTARMKVISGSRYLLLNDVEHDKEEDLEIIEMDTTSLAIANVAMVT